ncbi:MAG: response regulator [Flavobacteriales bacterium]|jgi:DNA-binding response OmpR family regulator|nr:response regulator [Flavobacteriales bacterium]MBK6550229.1 response regulator [Flavobacteriales bacterium]MBK6881607.1 response regulator [Flavobacteriales bacterium]MBK7102923.1 response regulator [Flavobacteriales bacterium]MBK7113472.1 response regulator [Flavobacteriales bacterium]
MKKRILLVDDEPEICFLLQNLIQRAGMECRITNTLGQARVALAEGKFDAVFLDVHLSDGRGYDLISDIRKTAPGTRCIAISAVDDERGNAMQAGADAFIPKPFTQAEILLSLDASVPPAKNNIH